MQQIRTYPADLSRVVLWSVFLFLIAGCDGRSADEPVPSQTDSPVVESPDEPPSSDPQRVPGTASPPSIEGAIAPNPVLLGTRFGMTWVEPSELGHRVRFAHFDGEVWSNAHTMVDSDRVMANWADFPGVARHHDGSLLGYYLRTAGASPYAYEVVLMRSEDDGETWTDIGVAHDDGVEGEHGFVSLVPTDESTAVFYLDGRETGLSGGAMTLRRADVEGLEVATNVLLDQRICDCCNTGAAMTDAGPIVAYRDRSENEIRDISFVAPGAGIAPLEEDTWHIEGCPVNGPQIAARGGRVAAAWFTAADDQPTVKLAFSNDGGAHFESAIHIDDSQPIGRVDVEFADDGDALLLWLARIDEERAAVHLARVEGQSPHRINQSLVLGETSAGRASGFVRMARQGEHLLVSWVRTGPASGIEARYVAIDSLPNHAAGQSDPQTTNRGVSAPERLPTATLQTIDGANIELSEHRNRPTLIVFWAGWCAPCLEEVPTLNRLHHEYSEAGLRVLGIDVEDSPLETLRESVAGANIEYPVTMSNESLAARFGVPPLPATFVFDRNGALIFDHRGVDAASIEALQAIVAGQMAAPE